MSGLVRALVARGRATGRLGEGERGGLGAAQRNRCDVVGMEVGIEMEMRIEGGGETRATVVLGAC